MAELPEKMRLMDRHFVSLQGVSKAFIVELCYYPNSDVVSQSMIRSIFETRMIYNSSVKIITQAATDTRPAKTQPMFDLWLARPDRPVKMRVDFLATEAERAANPKVLSSFNGLFLETTERMTNAEAAANSGVQIILDFVSLQVFEFSITKAHHLISLGLIMLHSSMKIVCAFLPCVYDRPSGRFLQSPHTLYGNRTLVLLFIVFSLFL